MSQRLFKQKQMSSSNASTSSVGQAISPEEEMIVTRSNEKILRIVMDQWILYTHYKVKLQIQKNIGLARLFSRLENKHQITTFESLLKLNAYSYKVKR